MGAKMLADCLRHAAAKTLMNFEALLELDLTPSLCQICSFAFGCSAFVASAVTHQPLTAHLKYQACAGVNEASFEPPPSTTS